MFVPDALLMTRDEMQLPSGLSEESATSDSSQRFLHDVHESLEGALAHPELLDDEGLVRLINRFFSVVDASLPSDAERTVERQIDRIDIEVQRNLVESVIVQWLERHGYVATKNPALRSYLETAMVEADIARRRSLLQRVLGIFLQPTALAGQEQALAEAQSLVQQCLDKEREGFRLDGAITDAQQRLEGIQADITRILADARTAGDRFRQEGERQQSEMVRSGEREKVKLVAAGNRDKDRLVGEATAEAVTKNKEVAANIATLQQAEAVLQQRIEELTTTKHALLEGLEVSEAEYVGLMQAMRDVAKVFHAINDDTLDTHFADVKTILQTFFKKLILPINNLSEKYGDQKRASVVKKLRAEVKATLPSYRVKFSSKRADPVFSMGLLDSMLEMFASEESDTMRAEVELGNLLQPFFNVNPSYGDDTSKALKELVKGLQQREAQPRLDEELSAIEKGVGTLKSIVVQANSSNARNVAQSLARAFQQEILTVIRTVDDKHGSSSRMPLVEGALASLDAEFASYRVDMQVHKIKLLQLVQQFKVWLEILQREKADVQALQTQFASTYLPASSPQPLEAMLQEGETSLFEQVQKLNPQR